MADSAPALIAHLRGIAAGQGNAPPAAATAWIADGLARAQVHELFAADSDDAASVAGFATALTLAAKAMPLLWIRTEEAQRRGGRLHATGLRELGLEPDMLVQVLAPDEGALLRAAADAARCGGLGAVMVESWGRAPGLDLTATRRLQLAAEASGVTVLLLRVNGQPAPSAAATRWGVAGHPSTALAADAPGRPAFLIELQRRRGGPSGQRWRVEWDRDTLSFDAEALSGTGLSVAADRAPARDAPAPLRAWG
ncbi:ImuA family protein [Sphingomonas sp.]|uniref:ImuA family protein n=1 Tax=Sphingomonas sp. TaxID=28214 RepID=UPI003CC6D5B2